MKRVAPCRHYSATGFCRLGNACGFEHDSKPICRHFLNGNCLLGDRCRFSHNPSNETNICRHFRAGNCNLGDNCRFSHIIPNDKLANLPQGPVEPTQTIMIHHPLSVPVLPPLPPPLPPQPFPTNIPTPPTQPPPLPSSPLPINPPSVPIPPASLPKSLNPCRHFLAGHCVLGDKCRFAHTVPNHPVPPPLCRHFKNRGFCRLGDTCRFSHRFSFTRPTLITSDGKAVCRHWATKGECRLGNECKFAHPQDLLPSNSGSMINSSEYSVPLGESNTATVLQTLPPLPPPQQQPPSSSSCIECGSLTHIKPTGRCYHVGISSSNRRGGWQQGDVEGSGGDDPNGRWKCCGCQDVSNRDCERHRNQQCICFRR